MKKKYSLYAVSGIIIAFCVGCSAYLLRPLWFDEALTLLNFTFQPLSRIYTNYSIPNNHIGFTMLLKLWYNILPAGVSPDVWCRLLSMLTGALYIIYTYFSFKRFSFRVALASFAVTVPFFIYATSVRGYMAALLFAAVALKCAIVFAERGRTKDGIYYFIASLCSIAVLPSNLFVLGSTAIYATAFCGKEFWKKRKFYNLCIIPLLAFFLFWGPILPQLLAAGRLGEGWQDRLSSLYAGFATFTACGLVLLFFAAAGFVCRRRCLKTILHLLVFLPLLTLVFWAEVAPFPRVYFPFATVFMLIASEYAEGFIAFVRLKKRTLFPAVKYVFALLSVSLAFALTNISGSRMFFSKLNGMSEKDDYFIPWYIKGDHQPHLAADFLAKQDYQCCYLSFSSDPWSVMFYSAISGADLRKFCFDGPQGRVQEIPYGAIAVMNRSESVPDLEKRFECSFTEVAITPMHRILRKN